MSRRHRTSPIPFILLIVLCCGVFSLALWMYSAMHNEVQLTFGPPSDRLSLIQQNLY
jgi:hypothetical protein